MQLNIWIAFGAGIASFISPCCLPLYPSYLSYLTGVSVSELRDGADTSARLRTLLHALFFVIGLSVIFYTVGWGTGMLSDFFKENRNLIRQLSALLIFVMGLVMVGLISPTWLMREKKVSFKWKPAGYLGAFLIGIGFAAGWSPCVGPILSSILALTATDPGSWFWMISAYCLGFAIPFLVLAFFIGKVKAILRYSSLLMKVGGAVMIVIAFMLYTDRMTHITIWFNAHTPGWLQF